MKLLAVLVVALLVSSAVGDVYMNGAACSRGSNNRLNEQSADRNNGDRLFDSQNNNRGGYNVGVKTKDTFPNDITQADTGPDTTYTTTPMTAMQYQSVLYEGSIAIIEWTAQHACGGNEQDDPQKINCNIVLQYMCNTDTTVTDPAMQVVLRDGLNTQTPQEPGSITDVPGNNANLGHHESEAYYYECKTRSRNRGLFHADQNINGQTARFTRQNNNGNRNGLECPEERDYWPYWSPAPWIDIAYLTDDLVRCNTLLKPASQNTATVYKCTAATPATRTNDILFPITEAACITAGGTWTPYTKAKSAPPCVAAQWSRDNHLGNGRDGEMVTYNWTVPSAVSATTGDARQNLKMGAAGNYAKCAFRLRYNISTDDYDPWNINSTADNNPQKGIVSPVQENPYVDVGADLQGLRLAINTNQFGRTFQDRSHVFYIRSRPAGIPAAQKIINLSVRGKRGNIVQTYPAVEYDYTPNRVHIGLSDLLHIQWTGSNTHNNGNPGGDGQTGDAGEGTGGTDRQNIAQMLNLDDNYPIPLDKYPNANMWAKSTCRGLEATATIATYDCAVLLATSGQFRTIAEATSATTTTFNPLLNDAPASLVGGILMQFSTKGSYIYMNTRNNNFSNRSQKGIIIVDGN